VTSRNHGASAQRRRALLLDAAAELAAERGAGAVTHRAVAARAGLPPSTTTYFFSSIDEMVEEALRVKVATSVADLRRLAGELESSGAAPEVIAERYAERLLRNVTTGTLTEIEALLTGVRRPELRDAVQAAAMAYEDVTIEVLRMVGARNPEFTARAVRAMIDGFVLHHMANPRPDDVAVMRDALITLVRTADAAPA
jgi:DNA-binding transcriptional regulator YbjK